MASTSTKMLMRLMMIEAQSKLDQGEDERSVRSQLREKLKAARQHIPVVSKPSIRSNDRSTA